MSRIIAVLTSGALGLMASVTAHAASPADGMWRSPTRHGVVELYDCDADLCGRVVASDILKARPNQRDVRNHDPALRGRLVKGLTILQGLSGGPRDWSGGTIYDPNNGVSYHGSLTLLDAHRVKVVGCVMAPLCGAQVWTRIE